MNVYIYVYMSECMYICVGIYMCAHIQACKYVCMYIYIYQQYLTRFLSAASPKLAMILGYLNDS